MIHCTPTGSSPGWRECLVCWPWCWRASGFTESWPTPWRAVRETLEFAWHSVHNLAVCCGWSCGKRLLVVVGVAVGLPVAYAGTHLLKSMLFGLGLVDPVAIVVSAMSLAGVAALAGFLPARRAMRVDPMVALRYE